MIQNFGGFFCLAVSKYSFSLSCSLSLFPSLSIAVLWEGGEWQNWHNWGFTFWSVALFSGLYGVGTRQECGFLERHDHNHGGWNQQTEKTGGLWKGTRSIISSFSPLLTSKCTYVSLRNSISFFFLNDLQVTAATASTQLWAPTSTPCSKESHTASCRLSIST